MRVRTLKTTVAKAFCSKHDHLYNDNDDKAPNTPLDRSMVARKTALPLINKRPMQLSISKTRSQIEERRSFRVFLMRHKLRGRSAWDFGTKLRTAGTKREALGNREIVLALRDRATTVSCRVVVQGRSRSSSDCERKEGNDLVLEESAQQDNQSRFSFR
jgi:hypothetical protein